MCKRSEVVFFGLINDFLTDRCTFCQNVSIVKRHIISEHKTSLSILPTEFLIVNIIHTAEIDLHGIRVDVEILGRSSVLLTSLWMGMPLNNGIIRQTDRLVVELGVVFHCLEHHEQRRTNNGDRHVNLEFAPLSEFK